MTHPRKPQSWLEKFRIAGSGIVFALLDQKSFYVHVPCAIGVLALAIWMRLDWVPLGILLICIGMVLGAEMFNTSLEYLARAVTEEANENVRRALDVASGAVLVVSFVAAVVGAMILLPRLISIWIAM